MSVKQVYYKGTSVPVKTDSGELVTIEVADEWFTATRIIRSGYDVIELKTSLREPILVNGDVVQITNEGVGWLKSSEGVLIIEWNGEKQVVYVQT